MKLLPRKPLRIETSRSLIIEKELAKCLKTDGASQKEIVTVLRQFREAKEEIAGLAKRRGRAKGGGQSSNAKGRKGVQDVKALLLKTFQLVEDDMLVKATSMGGCDLHLSPEAQRLFPFAIEVKCQESLNIWAALAQAQVNADKKQQPAIVFFKRARSPMYIAMRADAFLRTIASGK